MLGNYARAVRGWTMPALKSEWEWTLGFSVKDKANWRFRGLSRGGKKMRNKLSRYLQAPLCLSAIKEIESYTVSDSCSTGLQYNTQNLALSECEEIRHLSLQFNLFGLFCIVSVFTKAWFWLSNATIRLSSEHESAFTAFSQCQLCILTSSTSLSKATMASGAERLALDDIVVPTGDASLT